MHGCFWHRHLGCRRATEPQSRADYWRAKFERNVERDENAKLRLEQLGWQVVIIWECETKDPNALIQRFLEIAKKPYIKRKAP